jgi:hypothetical protein
LPTALQQASQGVCDLKALERSRVPTRLAAVCRKALSRDAQARYATAKAFGEALTAAVYRPRWHWVAGLASLFIGGVVGGVLIGQTSGNRAVVSAEPTLLDVRVWRKDVPGSRPLVEMVPLHTDDELQVHFRVPSGLYVGLFYVNGVGELSLVMQYPPQANTAEVIYPVNGRVPLTPPEGTEVLLVCGKADAPVSKAEIQAVWQSTEEWPALLPSKRLLRLQPDQVHEIGERPRNLGEVRTQPGPDAVVRRLEKVREQLHRTCTLLEGLAFGHN